MGEHFHFPEHAALPLWKLWSLHMLARWLGVSIHIEGVPWGKPGDYIGAHRANSATIATAHPK